MAGSGASYGRADAAGRRVGCLHQVIGGGVPAEGASSLWNPQIFGGGSLVDEVEEGTDANALPMFAAVIFHCGGAGARPTKDGLSATAFPSGVRTIPVEATETRGASRILSPRVPRGLGRSGRFRGGLGQVIELGGAGALRSPSFAISSASTTPRGAATAAGPAHRAR